MVLFLLFRFFLVNCDIGSTAGAKSAIEQQAGALAQQENKSASNVSGASSLSSGSSNKASEGSVSSTGSEKASESGVLSGQSSGTSSGGSQSSGTSSGGSQSSGTSSGTSSGMSSGTSSGMSSGTSGSSSSGMQSSSGTNTGVSSKTEEKPNIPTPDPPLKNEFIKESPKKTTISNIYNDSSENFSDDDEISFFRDSDSCSDYNDSEVKWGRISHPSGDRHANVKFWKIPSQNIRFKNPNRIQILNYRKDKEQKITPIETDLLEGNAFTNLFNLASGKPVEKEKLFEIENPNFGRRSRRRPKKFVGGDFATMENSAPIPRPFKEKKGGLFGMTTRGGKHGIDDVCDEKTFKVKIVGYNTDVSDGKQRNVMLVGKNRLGDEILIQQQVTEKVIDM